MYDNDERNNQSLAEDNSGDYDYSSFYDEPQRDTSVGKIVAALLLLFGVVGVLTFQYPKLVNKVTGHKYSVSAAESIPVDGEMIAEGEEDMGDYFYNEAGGEGEGGGEENNGDGGEGEMIAEGGEGGENNGEWNGEENNGDNGEGGGEDNGEWNGEENNGDNGEGGGEDNGEWNGEENNGDNGEWNGEENGEDAINFDNGEDNSLMVSLGTSGRQHPFLPHARAKARVNQVTDFDAVPFEIIEPPTTYLVDPAINKLLEAKITGILYDSASPSAVVVIDGVDEFVKVGDKIFGYTISQITRDKVVISYGSNTFTASIGQLFSQQEMTMGRTVPNLEKKFSGSRR